MHFLNSSLNHQTFLDTKHFGSLDGLRAISILAVIWHHTVPSTINGPLAHFGCHGVTLFFAISGFLITTLLLRERDSKGSIDLKSFYWRRSLRIFPLYFAVLALYIVVVFALERNSEAGLDFFDNLKYFATYTSNIFVPLSERTIFYFSWSLACEEQFYLIWPITLITLGVLPRAAKALAILIAILVVDNIFFDFLSVVPLAIVAGTFLALALHSPTGFNHIQRWLGHKATPVVLIGILAVSFGCRITGAWIDFACVAIVCSCVIREDHYLRKVFSLQPIVFIGTVSYGLYMLHMLSKSAVTMACGKLNFPQEGLHIPLGTLCIGLVAAAASFFYYESHFLRLKHKKFSSLWFTGISQRPAARN